MFLEVKNIAKIENAKIEIRGITVIAGNNNTGKSTFGKILYCMFNSFYDAENAIQKERRHSLENIIYRYFHFPLTRFRNPIITPLVNTIIDHQNSPDDIRNIINEAIQNEVPGTERIESSIIDLLLENINRSISVKDQEIQKRIISNFFQGEFNDQINHVNHPDTIGKIVLTIKGKNIEINIKGDECVHLDVSFDILYNALYLDTPFILDELDNHRYNRIFGYQHSSYLLNRLHKEIDNINLVDEVIVREKIQNILSKISFVINGEFRQKDTMLGFQETGLNIPLSFGNISAGMKPFLIIKRLLETGEIKENGVLVFDEPEIHLHPEWQLNYAELLVLLQKEFDLNILLTTHSPYFLNAIEVYSERYNTVSNCNFYLTDCVDEICHIEDVTNKIDSVYKRLSEPFQKLENIRYGANQ
ncbi:MAG: ATP-binding protein [Treponema sp.]|jgi:predicted ATPase|nr:ATP-binding protein [Treponema sp.]